MQIFDVASGWVKTGSNNTIYEGHICVPTITIFTEDVAVES